MGEWRCVYVVRLSFVASDRPTPRHVQKLNQPDQNHHHRAQVELSALHARCQQLTREGRRKERLVKEVMALKQARMAPLPPKGGKGGAEARAPWEVGERERDAQTGGMGVVLSVLTVDGGGGWTDSLARGLTTPPSNQPHTHTPTTNHQTNQGAAGIAGGAGALADARAGGGPRGGGRGGGGAGRERQGVRAGAGGAGQCGWMERYGAAAVLRPHLLLLLPHLIHDVPQHQPHTQELELRACRAKLRAYGAEIGGMKRILASAAASAVSILPTAAGEGASVSSSSDGGESVGEGV